MQFGESIAMIRTMIDNGECVICSKKHDQPKKEDIKEVAPSNSNWRRKSDTTEAFERIGVKNAIYPNNKFPPNYGYQSHHCIALNTLVDKANSKGPSDRNIRLNHFLNKVGVHPNRDQNFIGLPRMKQKKNPTDYVAFNSAADAGKPLQLHGPGHDNLFFTKCTLMIQKLLHIIVPTTENECKAKSKEEWEDDLRTLASEAENHAFVCLANASWGVHPKELSEGIRLYEQSHPDVSLTFPTVKLNEGPFKK